MTDEGVAASLRETGRWASFLVGWQSRNVRTLSKLTESVTSDLSSLDCQYAGDSDTPSEGLASYSEAECGWDEYGWDTDDEVEEANAFDDIIKIIEGDW